MEFLFFLQSLYFVGESSDLTNLLTVKSNMTGSSGVMVLNYVCQDTGRNYEQSFGLFFVMKNAWKDKEGNDEANECSDCAAVL